MNDDLERFINRNRDAFDDREPPETLWQRIEEGLSAEPGKVRPLNGKMRPENVLEISNSSANARTNSQSTTVRPLWRSRLVSRWMVAASVMAVLLAGGFWLANARYGLTRQPDVVAAAPEYASDFANYARLIDTKRAELRQMTQADPGLYQQFATDLDRLENSYQGLKADLPQNPNQEVLIQAMIQNLQLQIDLLNEQLRVIQQMKQQRPQFNKNVL
jgi:hypothetical protein